MSILNLIANKFFFKHIRVCLIPALVYLATCLPSCKKFIDTEPSVTQPSAQVVYKDNKTAASVLSGIYSDLAGNSILNGQGGISVIGGLSADELTASPSADPVLLYAYSNSLHETDNVPFWSRFYFYIYTANTVLENLENSPAVTSDVKQQLTGEAKFIRAFSYFYLLNFFGDVPLLLTTDYRVNASATRTDKNQVWTQILADLKDAKSILNSNYVESDGVSSKTSTERVRPNKWAATALLARAYLYTKDWANAEEQASEVINMTASYQLEPDLNKAFLRTSKEAIWQLQPVTPGYNTFDGNVFVLTGSPDYSSPVTVSDSLLNAFEIGDKRKVSWVGSYKGATGPSYYFPNKYKVKTGTSVTEYLIVLRLAEQFLIRAEARAQNNNLSGAIADINTIRSRSGLLGTTVLTQAEILAVILKERRVELFAEMAHRWLDLKRTGKVNDVMAVVTPQKGGTWSPNWQLYPIPYYSARVSDKNLAQNLGY